MKFSRYFFAAAALMLCLSSCKEEEEETLYHDGTLSISMKAYLAPGESKSFQVDTMTTLSRPDGLPIGYFFRASAFAVLDTVKRLTDTKAREFTFTVPDSLGQFTLLVSGFSDGYTSTSATSSFTIVKPGHGEDKSITGFEILPTDKTFKDARDGHEYYYITVGKTQWMRENLAWQGKGVGYVHCDVMSSIYGRYYTWNDAQVACPEGWRLPKEADWINLVASLGIKAEPYSTIPDVAAKLMENISFNGTVMWPYTRYVRIDNKARFSAMPSGYVVGMYLSPSFKGLNSYSVFWLGEEEEGMGLCRYIYKEQNYLYSGTYSKSDFGASVRCVKDL